MTDEFAGSRSNRDQFALSDVARDDTRVSSLTLSTELRDSVVDYLRRCLPHEGVGLLATSGAASFLTAVRFYPGQNMDRSPRRYTMNQADVLAALASMKREKTRLGVIVHSHPITSPVPSRTDLLEANYPGVLSLIVGFSPRIELRAWRLVYGSHGLAVRFDPVPLIFGCRVEKSPLGLLSSAGSKEECAEIQ
jgi:[CysO sulfur-carrier protein]-S-L-cysteine hydrolase